MGESPEMGMSYTYLLKYSGSSFLVKWRLWNSVWNSVRSFKFDAKQCARTCNPIERGSIKVTKGSRKSRKITITTTLEAWRINGENSSLHSFLRSFVSGKRNWRVLRLEEEDKGISQRSGKMAFVPIFSTKAFLGGIQSVLTANPFLFVFCVPTCWISRYGEKRQKQTELAVLEGNGGH